MHLSSSTLQLLSDTDPAIRRVLIAVVEELDREIGERVTRKDFQELRDVVYQLAVKVDQLAVKIDQLAQAQQRTEERIDQLAQAQQRTEERIDQLAQAQQHTEERIDQLAQAQQRTEERIDQLAQAQQRTEERIDQLAQAQQRTEERIDQLAQAQQRTEERIDQLAQAQQRTEERVDQLAQAQQQTEKELQKLARSHKDLQRQVGGLSMAVGYGIEDQLMPFIPAFAAREYGVTVTRVERTVVEYGSGGYDEVNILAKGTDRDGNPAYLVGECKSQPGKRDLARFAKMIQRLRTVLHGAVHPVLIGFMYDPATERHAKASYPEIRLLKTYQIRQIAEETRGAEKGSHPAPR